eukprot:6584923-Prymnesium_polylepis.2
MQQELNRIPVSMHAAASSEASSIAANSFGRLAQLITDFSFQLSSRSSRIGLTRSPPQAPAKAVLKCRPLRSEVLHETKYGTLLPNRVTPGPGRG